MQQQPSVCVSQPVYITISPYESMPQLYAHTPVFQPIQQQMPRIFSQDSRYIRPSLFLPLPLSLLCSRPVFKSSILQGSQSQSGATSSGGRWASSGGGFPANCCKTQHDTGRQCPAGCMKQHGKDTPTALRLCERKNTERGCAFFFEKGCRFRHGGS